MANVIVDQQRDLNFRFMVAEWLWILAGRNDVVSLAKYNKQIAQFSDDGVTFNGAYGPRLSEQWREIVHKLRCDRDSRQAVAAIFFPFDISRKTKDVPCTLGLQVLIRDDNYLHGIVTMRSQDLWLGLPYDFFTFSMLCNGLAAELDATPGSLTFNVGSAHIYEPNWEAVMSLTGQGYCVSSPELRRIPAAHAMLDGNARELDKNEKMYDDILNCAGKREALTILEGK